MRVSLTARASIAVLVCVTLTVACSSGKKTPPASTTSSAGSSVTSSSAAPSPTPSSSAPLSPFEADPAVVALRAWSSQVAKDFNAGQTFTDPALLKLETPSFATTVAAQFASDAAAHLTYPGPLPFQPTSVAPTSPTVHVIAACVVADGFATAASGQPPNPLKVVSVNFNMALTDGTWKVDTSPDGTFDCSTTKVATQTW